MNIETQIAVGLLIAVLAVISLVLYRKSRNLQSDLANQSALLQDQTLVLERLKSEMAYAEDQKQQANARYEETASKLEATRQQLHEIENKHHGLNAENLALKETRENVQTRLAQQEQDFASLQNENQVLRTEQATLKVSLAERDERYREQVVQFEKQKQALEKEFENLANRIFEEKGKVFSQNN